MGGASADVCLCFGTRKQPHDFALEGIGHGAITGLHIYIKDGQALGVRRSEEFQAQMNHKTVEGQATLRHGARKLDQVQCLTCCCVHLCPLPWVMNSTSGSTSWLEPTV